MSKSKWLLTLGTVALTLALPGQALAASGDADTSFNQDGMARVFALGVKGSTSGFSVVAAGGKIVVAGAGRSPGGDGVIVARFGPNGYPDGSCGNGNGFKVLSFGSVKFSENSLTNALAVLPDNKILIAGSVGPGTRHMFVARLQANCERDGSFGTSNGAFISDFGFGFGAQANDLAVLPDGKILVAGSVAHQKDQDNVALWRFMPDGSLDHSFGGGDGMATLNAAPGSDGAWRLAVLPTGQVIVGGWTTPPSSSNSKILLASFNADGSVDYNFGANGIVIHNPTGAPESVTGMAIANGRIYVSADGRYGGDPVVVLMRLKMDGTRDGTFGSTGGQTLWDLGPSDLVTHDLVAQPDGKLVLVGRQDFHWLVFRMLADGAKDLSFGTGGFTTTADYGDGQGVTLDGSGRILVTGDATGNLGVARFLP